MDGFGPPKIFGMAPFMTGPLKTWWLWPWYSRNIACRVVNKFSRSLICGGGNFWKYNYVTILESQWIILCMQRVFSASNLDTITVNQLPPQ